MDESTVVASETDPVGRIPVTIVTGFLGAGKTTILNDWVRQPTMAGAAVLVNEFGSIGVDHHLIEAADEQMVILDSGCLCCSIQGDLVAALRRVFLRAARRDVSRITRVVIETTGLADPVPILYTIMEEPFVSARYVCDAVIAVISAQQGRQQLAEHPEARRQIIAADRIVVTKTDLASTQEISLLARELRSLNPAAPRTEAVRGSVPVHLVARTAGYGQRDRAEALQSWLVGEIEHHRRQRDNEDASGEGTYLANAGGRSLLGGSRHTSDVQSLVIVFDRDLPWFGFSVRVGEILQAYRSKILRLKGIVRLAGGGQPRVVQCVQDVAYPAVSLERWPDDPKLSNARGYIVIIARGLEAADATAIEQLMQAMPQDAAALRSAAGNWQLPTRCWLGERVQPINAQGLVHEAWVIQPRYLNSRHSQMHA